MLKYILLIVCTLFVNLYGSQIDTQNLDEKALLESLFGKQVSSDVKDFPVPIVINGNNFTIAKIDIKNDEVFLVKSDIEKVLSLTTIKNWEDELKEKAKVSLNYFKEKNIEASYDDKQLRVVLEVPPKLFKVNTIMFNVTKEQQLPKDTIESAKYSGVSNFYIQQNFSDSDEGSLLREELNLRNSFFINFNETILNGSYTYQENRDRRFQRGSFFLERDQTKSALRYKLGEIHLPTSFRLSPQNALGFSATTQMKLFNLNHQNTTRVNQYEFFIERDSRVKLYINDIYKKAINLKAGTHNIYDLNIPQGLSKVKLVIEDKYGEVDIVEFDDYHYNDILTPGTFLYGYGIGIKRYDDGNKITFYEDKEILSFNVKYGLTNNITVEAGANISDDISYAYDIYYGTKFGKFNQYYSDNKVTTNNSSTRKKEIGLGFNTRVWDTSFNLYKKRAKEYSNDVYEDTLDTSYISAARRLTTDINVNTNYSIQKTDTSTENTFNIGLDYEINDKLSCDLDFTNKTSTSNVDQRTISVLFTYRYDDTTYSYDRTMDTYADSSDNETKTTYSVNHRIKGDTDYTVTAYKRDSTRYETSKELSVRADDIKYKLYTKYLKDSNGRDHINLSLQTAIAFADNKAAFTRPISGSFIILSNNSAIEDNIVGVKNKPIRKNVVITNNDYHTKKVLLDESKLLKNYSLKKSIMYVNSKYKSGSLIDINLPVTYLVKGTLLNENNEPIPFGAFEIVDQKTKKSHLTFTNKEGVFYLENIKPSEFKGSYINPSKKDKNKGFNFVISDEERKTVEIDIGDLQVI